MSGVTPTAPATRNLPKESLQAFGLSLAFTISLKVINPVNLLSESTTGSFSILYCCKILSAVVISAPF